MTSARSCFLYGLAAAGLTFFTISLCLGSMYYLSWSARRDAIRRDLVHSAVEVALVVDATLHQQLTSPDQHGTPLHTRALAPMVAFHRKHRHLYYVFTMVVKDGEYYFILDTATDDRAPKLDENVEASGIMEPYAFEPDEAEAIRRTVLERGETYTKDDFFIGSFGTFVTAFAPILNDQGEPVAIAGVDFSLDSFNREFADIRSAALWTWGASAVLSIFIGYVVWHVSSLRRQAVLAHHESQERYRELVRLLPAMVIEVDNRGVITYANQYTAQCLGMEADSLREARATRLFSESSRRQMLEDMKRIQAGESIVNREYELVRRDGKQLIALCQASPMFSRKQFRGVRVVLFDITGLRSLQKELNHADKMRAIGHLAGGVAHDFNNMLTVIEGFAGLIDADTSASDTVREQVGFIRDAAKRATVLVSKLLAFARKGDFRKESIDINAMIEHTISLLKPGLLRSIRIEKRFEADNAWITGDPGQIENALVNLAVNAKDAMPDGGVLTFATAFANLSAADIESRGVDLVPGRYVTVTVADTGIGMDEETRDRVFEPFFTTKAPGAGTGMGLASIYGTAKTHGGQVTCDSKEGKGSSFTLYLPASRERAEASASPSAQKESDNYQARVLIVDDEPSVAAVCAAMLERLGCAAVTCSDAGEALEWYREHHTEIDLVLLDMVMPGLSSREVFRRLRACNPEVKVLLVSGYSVSANVQALLDEGALGLIAKPFDAAVLARELCRLADVCGLQVGD